MLAGVYKCSKRLFEYLGILIQHGDLNNAPQVKTRPIPKNKDSCIHFQDTFFAVLMKILATHTEKIQITLIEISMVRVEISPIQSEI